MDSKIKLGIFLFIISFTTYQCVDSNLKLNFDSAVGIYKSNCNKGEETLELKSDSTYVYKFKAYNEGSSTFINKGKWSLINDVGEWSITSIKFTDWIDKAYIGYISEKDYINQNKDLYEESQVRVFLERKMIYHIEFTVDVKSFKSYYILRRILDAQPEYDFVKISPRSR